MRLVLDTNVDVSALVWGGVPYRLIEAAAAGDVDLVTSPALLAELRDVLGREHLASRMAVQRSLGSSRRSRSMPTLPSPCRRSLPRESCPAMSMTITSSPPQWPAH